MSKQEQDNHSHLHDEQLSFHQPDSQSTDLAPLAPTFIEAESGIQVAANVKVPEHLRFREGQNVYDQPPFSWVELVLTEVEYPEDFFLVNDETLLARRLIGVAVRMGVDLRELIALRPQEKARLVRNYGKLVKKYVEGIVATTTYSLEDEDNVLLLSAILSKIITFIREFPFAEEYVKEHVISSDKNFDQEGQVLPKRLRGTFEIKTYAAYAADKMSRDPKNYQQWVGLEELLPDDSADPRTNEAPKNQYRVFRSSSTSTDSAPDTSE